MMLAPGHDNKQKRYIIENLELRKKDYDKDSVKCRYVYCSFQVHTQTKSAIIVV